MAYTDIVNVDYTGRGNTSTGAANSTTGSGGELVWAGTKASPLVPFGFGMLMVHWFWKKD